MLKTLSSDRLRFELWPNWICTSPHSDCQGTRWLHTTSPGTYNCQHNLFGSRVYKQTDTLWTHTVLFRPWHSVRLGRLNVFLFVIIIVLLFFFFSVRNSWPVASEILLSFSLIQRIPRLHVQNVCTYLFLSIWHMEKRWLVLNSLYYVVLAPKSVCRVIICSFWLCLFLKFLQNTCFSHYGAKI